jgi:hypothetical protein
MNEHIPHRADCEKPEPVTIPARMPGWDLKRCPSCGGAAIARTAVTSRG